MWLCLNNAYLSIVAPKPRDIPASERKAHGPGWETDLLMVRARKAEHLKAVFVGRRIYRWKGRDYPARVFVPRAQLAKVVAAHVEAITYDNFKNSVRDAELHDAYSSVWGVMHRYEHGGFKRRGLRERGFAWGRGYADDPWPIDDDDGLEREAQMEIDPPTSPCDRPGCTEVDPCMHCLVEAVEAQGPQGTYAEAKAHSDDYFDRLADEPDTSDIPEADEDWFKGAQLQGPERYGPYDEDDDSGAQSSLRHPPA